MRKASLAVKASVVPKNQFRHPKPTRMQPCARSAIRAAGKKEPVRFDYLGVLLCKERREHGTSTIRPSHFQDCRRRLEYAMFYKS